MADPYAIPRSAARPGSRVTLLSLIALVFSAVMVVIIFNGLADGSRLYEEGLVAPGDTVEYEFTARLADGTLISTNILSVAEAANITADYPLDSPFNYAPKKAVIDPTKPGLGWGPEIEALLVGAHAGKTLRFSVPPAYGLGDWEDFSTNPEGIPRELAPQFFQREVFLQETEWAAREGNAGTPSFNYTNTDRAIGPLTKNMVFNPNRVFPPSWDIIIDDPNPSNRSILFHHTVQHNQYFNIEGMPGGVTVLLRENETQISYRFDLVKGGAFVVQPRTDLATLGFSPGSYLVREITDTHIDFGYHAGTEPRFVGQELKVELTILSKKAPAAPTGST